jgi:hypothetical protein
MRMNRIMWVDSSSAGNKGTFFRITVSRMRQRPAVRGIITLPFRRAEERAIIYYILNNHHSVFKSFVA